MDFATDDHDLVYFDFFTAILPCAWEEEEVDFTVEVFKAGEGHGLAFFGGVGAEGTDDTGNGDGFSVPCGI